MDFLLPGDSGMECGGGESRTDRMFVAEDTRATHPKPPLKAPR